MFGMGAARMVCPECGGSGKVVADPCPACGGEGRTRVQAEGVVSHRVQDVEAFLAFVARVDVRGDIARVKARGNAGTNGGEAGDLVGRARVEAERLEGRARTGFYLVGFVLPFLIFSSISGVFGVFLMLCLIPLVLGVGMVVTDDVLHRSGLWWRRGLQVLLNGAANGFLLALMSVWFTSCTQSLFLAPFAMM